MSDFKLDKYTGTKEDRVKVLETLSSFVDRSKTIFGQPTWLPNAISVSSPEILFEKAAFFRGNLDLCSNILLTALAFRLQIKHAAAAAKGLYDLELREVYASKKSDIVSARGYEEREFLARNYIDKETQDRMDFWKQALSDIDDFIEMTKHKMRSFNGALDTILLQASLVKTANAYKGILSPQEMEYLDMVKDAKSKEGDSLGKEGEVSL